MTFKVAIVGAGPAGLICARILMNSSLDLEVTIFERDSSSSARIFRGGSLDLHGDTGLVALQKANLYEKAKEWLRWDGEEIFVSDKNGTIIFHMKDPPKSDLADYQRPEIDREMLKELLLDAVGKDKVQWGKVLQSIHTADRTMTFRDGSTAGPFDLTIGADGAFSRVREVLTDVKPVYSGLCGFEALIAEPDTKHPNLINRVGKGSLFAYSDKKDITVQRVFDQSLKVDLYWGTENQNFAHDIYKDYSSDQAALKRKVLESFSDWVPEMQEYITSCHILRPLRLYELPVGTTWENKFGYTLVGDAAGLMTPFSGEGANKALTDGMKLAEAIITTLETGSNMDQAIIAYEKDLFKRSTKLQKRTFQNKVSCFTPWGAALWPVNIGSFVLEDMGYDFQKGWLSLVPVLWLAATYFKIVQAMGGGWRKVKDLFRS